MKTMNDDNERVMVFIDLRNILSCQKEMVDYRTQIDFSGMVDDLVDNRKLLGAYIFDGQRDLVDNPCKKFHDALRAQGFRVIVRENFAVENYVQKEVDVAMACEIIIHAIKDHYDTAIVVSGDRDFRAALEHVQAEGKKVEVAGFSQGMSEILRRSCDKFHCLDSMPILTLKSVLVEDVEETIMPETTEVAEHAA